MFQAYVFAKLLLQYTQIYIITTDIDNIFGHFFNYFALFLELYL